MFSFLFFTQVGTYIFLILFKKNLLSIYEEPGTGKTVENNTNIDRCRYEIRAFMISHKRMTQSPTS